MSTENSANISLRKQELRAVARKHRAAQPNRDQLSRRIMRQALGLPAYADARTVAFYVDVRHEVRTRFDLPSALESDKRVLVPYCIGSDLQLFHLHDMDELAPGRFGVLEPSRELRTDSARQVAVQEVDVVIVPGVAFDRHGSRLGHGKSYYDRLLSHARADAVLVGLAFEGQIFDAIPTEPHDISMDRVVTESAVYIGRGHSVKVSPSCVRAPNADREPEVL